MLKNTACIFFLLIPVIHSFGQEIKCDASHAPIVFVHGFMGSGDNWSGQIQRFNSNGFCGDRLFVFDWNSFSGKNNVPSLDNFINTILAKTGAANIDLVGHSAGGKLCYDYLSDSSRATKVGHYVHTGSFPMKHAAGRNGEVPTMNIYSTDDKVLSGGADITGAVNVKLSGYDHLQTATGKETFEAMHNFFTGHAPLYKDIVATENAYKHAGLKGVVLGENKMLSGDSIRVFAIDPRTGKHRPVKDKATVYDQWKNLDSAGAMDLLLLKDSYTEIELRPKGGRRMFYYLEPLARDNNNIYLRVLPVAGMAAAMLGKLPADDQQVALVIFTANNAVIAGRDSLAIDDHVLSLPALMPAAKTSVACFVFDDGDGISSGKPLKSLGAAPFISGVDIFYKAAEKEMMRLFYNGRSLVLPKRKSSEGIMVVVFN